MPYDPNNLPQFSDTDIIRSMARTLEVLSYTSWCDAWDEANDPDARPEKAVSAGPGDDWFDVAPEVDGPWLQRATILYGRIEQAWGWAPWLVLVNNGIISMADAEAWGHYAVVSALGHGVCWEDHFAPLMKQYKAVSVTGTGIYICTPDYPGDYPGEPAC
jgi:hypothetical protein